MHLLRKMPSLAIAYLPLFFYLLFFSFPPRPFPTEESVNNEDIYKGLPDLIEYVGHFEQNQTTAKFYIFCGI